MLGVNSRDVTPIRFARAGCFRNRFVVIRFKPVDGRDDQVLAVLIITRALSQAEQIASRQTGGVAAPMRNIVLGMQLLQADFGVVAAVTGLGIFARIVVHLEIGQLMALGLFEQRPQTFAWRFKIEVVKRISARLHLLDRDPLKQVIAFPVVMDIRRKIWNRVITGKRAMRAVIIRQHQNVLAVFVSEVIVNAFLFHQPADEIEICLPVLHAVFPLAIAATQGILDEIGKAVFAENGLDDVRHGFVLENPAVRSAGQKPQPGT